MAEYDHPDAELAETDHPDAELDMLPKLADLGVRFPDRLAFDESQREHVNNYHII